MTGLGNERCRWYAEELVAGRGTGSVRFGHPHSLESPGTRPWVTDDCNFKLGNLNYRAVLNRYWIARGRFLLGRQVDERCYSYDEDDEGHTSQNNR